MTRSPGDRVAADLAADASGALQGGQVPDVVIEPDADRLARAVAEALVARLAAAQAVHGTASVVLTGGGIGIAVLERVAGLAAEPVRETVDWTAVEIWWGDERFVPSGDAERNEGQARAALLDRVGVPPARVHAMPAADSAASPEEAAEEYLAELRAHAGDGADLPRFDVLLLGMGAEGHTASIFPASPAVRDQRPVLAVRDCPKPPPTRVTLGYPAINSAEEVWVLVTGEAKAEAVAAALEGADPADVPAAGVRGTRATRWLLDADAASRLPRARG
ncbi:6-phosphogluconolactonase [Blastococcus sp. KM273128]|uniref:6-phosphogluconolactonase n=1 Tax=Blastococcus sp. KM273128 TaxID=2570314 RepID=UPI001F025EAB|nr:6-phosphogluconolactonase [Blastococcus sp. KM273128]MCF6743636.1 6-phosphogluconolactonase [Blastococcus sp. KM273128]